MMRNTTWGFFFHSICFFQFYFSCFGGSGVSGVSPEWKKNQIEAHLHSYGGTDTGFSIILAIEKQ